MDLALNETQEAILGSVRTLLTRHRRTDGHVLKRDPEYDLSLERELGEAGFLDIVAAGGAHLDAALLVELVAREIPVLPIGWRTLLWPALHCEIWPAVPWKGGADELTRFADSARGVVTIDEERDAVAVVDIADCEVRSAGATWGYPVAYVRPRVKGRALPISAADCLALWRIGLAAEIVGVAGAAFDHTIQYIKDRKQFGHPIAANQAIRHRAARLAVEVDKARWLTYEAAWRAPDHELAAAAATVAATMAELVFQEAHQMHGAIGYTREFPLHRWTMRLRALCKELGGAAAHAMAVTAARVASAGLTQNDRAVQN
jgi:alkylation response protein AidB-like acyl-CoA dehydrogenase